MRAIHLIIIILLLSACGADVPPPDAADAATSAEPEQAETEAEIEEPPVNPSTGELLPMPFAAIWAPALVDYEQMIERRVIRVVVPYGGYQFYYDDGRPRGAVYELVQRFETYMNEELGRRNVKVYVVVIPVSREELLPALAKGHADFVAADLTITEERAAAFSFSRPMLTGINEIVVTGPEGPELLTIDDLAGQEIAVRASSSYFEHLQRLADDFRERGLEPPEIRIVDELLEAEDLLEMLDVGMFGMTVLDDYKAEFWAGVFPNIVVRDDLIVNEGGSIAWVTRQDTPELMNKINRFLRRYGKGTLVGNDTFNRYLKDANRVRCAHSGQRTERCWRPC